MEKLKERLVNTAYFNLYQDRAEFAIRSRKRDNVSLEHESGLFDDKGNIAGGREHYYATKGFYELANNDFDSAGNIF